MEKKVITEFDELLKEKFDCLWIFLKPSSSTERLLLWLDWKLRGKITKTLPSISNKPTYIYVKGKLPYNYIVLVREPFEIKEFEKIINDLKFNKVLLFSTPPSFDSIGSSFDVFKMELFELEKSQSN